MDTPRSNQPRKKRDPERNKVNQKQYRKRLKASMDGLQRERAQNSRRYHERITRMKEPGEYEAFKAKKAVEGMRRYYNLPQDKCDEVRRKNRILNKAWIKRKKEEGTYKDYKRKLNVRRPQKVLEKRHIMGEKAWKALQKQRYQQRVSTQLRQRWDWLDRELARPFPLQWLPLDWADCEPQEEDSVVAIRTKALQQVKQYL